MRPYKISVLDDLGMDDAVKCYGCGWKTTHLYVFAESKEDAINRIKNGEGLCRDCFLDLLYEWAKTVGEE